MIAVQSGQHSRRGIITAVSSLFFSVETTEDGLRTGRSGTTGDEEGDRCTRQGESGLVGVAAELRVLVLAGLETLEINLDRVC